MRNVLQTFSAACWMRLCPWPFSISGLKKQSCGSASSEGTKGRAGHETPAYVIARFQQRALDGLMEINKDTVTFLSEWREFQSLHADRNDLALLVPSLGRSGSAVRRRGGEGFVRLRDRA